MKKLPLFFAPVALALITSCANYGTYYAGDFQDPTTNGDQYNELTENPFINVTDQAISTFSIDADGAAYANMRRYVLAQGQLPPAAAVRTEELINYFTLDYEYSDNTHPINLNAEISQCPWNTENKLIRIGIKGKPIEKSELPASNFVFLIDVSGSMTGEDRLDLLKTGFKQFVDQMSEEDRVAIVVYAGSAGTVLNSTSGSHKEAIKEAIDDLESGGSTAGEDGIISAYEIAQRNFVDGGNNRIIVGTDGDFNVGTSDQESLVALIEEKRELGIYLTVLGVGRGNLNDGTLEQMANNGNGTYEYIDNLAQLQKVFIHEFSKFFAVATDVKVQVEFDSTKVEAYRLIGYENRLLNEEDLEDDSKDAGEIGANQNITALYEIVPKTDSTNSNAATFNLDVRYKETATSSSVPMSMEVFDENNEFSASSDFMKFTAAVAAFAMVLRQSEYRGTSNYEDILSWLRSTNLDDEHGFKAEFETIVEKAQGF